MGDSLAIVWFRLDFSGGVYPKPIVSHAIAREIALEAFSKLKASGGVVSQ